MKFSLLKKSWIFWELCILCGVILISHIFYVIRTHQYPEQDEHVYLSFAVQFYDILKHPGRDILWQIFQVNRYRQPLYGFLLAIPLLFTGTAYTYKLALLCNAVFYIATIVGLYFLAKEFISKKSAFLASVIFSFYGFPLFYLHFTYSETSVTAFVVFSLLFLRKTRYFLNTTYTIWFALFFLLGNFVRWVVPLFVIGSLLADFSAGIYVQFNKKKRYIKIFTLNLFIFFIIGLLPILSLFYIPNILFFKIYVGENVAHGAEWMTTMVHPDLKGIQHVFSIHSIMFYFNIFSEQTVFFFALFLAGFIICVRFFRKYAFLLLGFIFSYSFFTFGSALKFDRYIVPIYPLMAVISAVTFDYVKNKTVLTICIILTIGIGFLNFLGSSWAIGPMGKQGLKDIVLPSFFPHPRRIYLTPMVWPPRKEELNADLFINLIHNDFGVKKKVPKVLATFAYHPFDNAVYSILTYEKRNIISSDTIRGMQAEDYFMLFTKINETDYLVLKDKNAIESYISNDNTQSYMLHRFNDVMNMPGFALPSAFHLVGRIHIPLDNSNMRLYRRMSKIDKQEWENFGMLFVKENPEYTATLSAVIEKVRNEETIN